MTRRFVLLLANKLKDAHRSLAAAVRASGTHAHAFSPKLEITWLPTQESADEADLLGFADTVAMDFMPESLERLPGDDAGRPVRRIRSRYHLEFGPAGERFVGEVLVRIVVPEDVTPAARVRPSTLLCGPGGFDAESIWILAGSEVAAGFGPMAWLDGRLADLVKCAAASDDRKLNRIVLSVCGFERAFVLAADPKGGPAGWAGSPLARATQTATVGSLLAASLRGAPHLQEVLDCLVNWANREPAARRLAVVQPLSANGFFCDDGHPNFDRDTGRPLVTPDGFVADRSRAGAAGGTAFPRDDNGLPRWKPYLAADPLITLLSGQRGTLGVPAMELQAGLAGTAAAVG